MNKKEMDKVVQEVKERLGITPIKEKTCCQKAPWILLGITVLATLIAIVLWIKSKEDEDIEEYYEYFDDEFEEDDDDIYAELADEVDEDVEYLEIKNFEDADDVEEN